ncbi:putative secreted protein (Por secretion system target)/choice-of-anchor A domain-containing protein [Dyadobacter jejuensis]|uniref:Putative secreted protein (Por secretion system target)/choice-of-anchor A domain-containing protein n=1 Tax=Dyadobacter jejuensis TaxID=1082580 RepID=A0A316B949_9BACT|nr:choice-of-anchor A family protein [Dyadobacter jejuensis]PWJ59067.1 putative secreted protein (Por secretion system target)/choice-of-anchor A domain-containing protein [Dyadobacter jejuensis]
MQSYFKFLLLNMALCWVIPGQSVAQSPTAPALKFNIFVKGNTILQSSETEGPVAIGGNLTSNQYQISFDKSLGIFHVGGVSIGLAVRGGVNLNSGSLTINGNNYVKIGNCTTPTPLKTWYRDNNGAASNIRITKATSGYGSTPNITLNAQANSFGSAELSDANNPICQNVFGTGSSQIDIDKAFTNLISNSDKLALLADNLPIKDQNGNTIPGAEMGPYKDPSKFGNNPRIVVDPNKINVLTVSAAVWNSIQNINIQGIPNGPSQVGAEVPNKNFGLIINIVDYPAFGGTLSFPGFGGLNDSQGSYILYNFPDASSTLTVGGNAQISGTLLAPRANLIKDNNGNINGQVIADQFTHQRDEIHFWPFQPDVPLQEDKTITVTGGSECDNNAPWLNYTITPNYDATGATAKIEWINANDEVVKTETNQPLSGRLLFPGAAIDADGKGIAWPGWTKVDGKWQEIDDANASIKKAGSKIRVTVSPTTTFAISYPESSSTCKTSPPDDTPLPVKLASYSVEKVNCAAVLQWTVAEAENFSHFEVERSTNATSFVALDEVTYNATQDQYEYIDSPFSKESNQAGNQYYRLKQVDMDGSFEYSTIKAISDRGCAVTSSVAVYPNPAINELTVSSTSNIQKVEVFSMNAARVKSVQPVVAAHQAQIGIGSLPSGTYVMRVVDEQGVTQQKFVKQ